MKYCISCGKELPENVKTCPYCGTEVPVLAERPAPAVPAAPQPAPAAPASAPGQQAEKAQAAPRWEPVWKRMERGYYSRQFEKIRNGKKTGFSFENFWWAILKAKRHGDVALFVKTALPVMCLLYLAFALLFVDIFFPSKALLVLACVLFGLMFATLLVCNTWYGLRYTQYLYKRTGGDVEKIWQKNGYANLYYYLVAIGGFVLILGLLFVLYIFFDVPTDRADGLPIEPPAISDEVPPDGQAETQEPAQSQSAEPAPTPEPTPEAQPEPAPEAGAQAVPRTDIYYIQTDELAPWHGVWKDADTGWLMLFEAQEIGGDYGEQQPDGSWLITVQYLDGGEEVGYRLSADGNTLEGIDADGNVYATYVTPGLEDAPAPLPQELWGYYGCTEALDYALPVYVDAFRFGDALYTNGTDNGDGAYTLMTTDEFGMEEPIDVQFYTDGTNWYFEWVYNEYLPPYGRISG